MRTAILLFMLWHTVRSGNFRVDYNLGPYEALHRLRFKTFACPDAEVNREVLPLRPTGHMLMTSTTFVVIPVEKHYMDEAFKVIKQTRITAKYHRQNKTEVRLGLNTVVMPAVRCHIDCASDKLQVEVNIKPNKHFVKYRVVPVTEVDRHGEHFVCEKSQGNFSLFGSDGMLYPDLDMESNLYQGVGEEHYTWRFDPHRPMMENYTNLPLKLPTPIHIDIKGEHHGSYWGTYNQLAMTEKLLWSGPERNGGLSMTPCRKIEEPKVMPTYVRSDVGSTHYHLLTVPTTDCIPSITPPLRPHARDQYRSIYLLPNMDIKYKVHGFENKAYVVKENKHAVITSHTIRDVQEVGFFRRAINCINDLIEDVESTFLTVEQIFAYVRENIGVIVFLLALASPIAAALPFQHRVLLALFLWTKTAFAINRDTELFTNLSGSLRASLFVNVLFLSIFKITEKNLLALANLTSIMVGYPIASSAIHAFRFYRTKEYNWKTAFMVISSAFGIPGAALIYNIIRLPYFWGGKGEDGADPFERVCSATVEKMRSIFRYPFEDICAMRSHSSGLVFYVTTNLKQFLAFITRRKITNKMKKRPRVVSHGVRRFRAKFFYPDEYAILAPHLGQMSKNDLNILENGLPTILTRREWDMGPLEALVPHLAYQTGQNVSDAWYRALHPP